MTLPSKEIMGKYFVLKIVGTLGTLQDIRQGILYK